MNISMLGRVMKLISIHGKETNYRFQIVSVAIGMAFW